LIDLSDGKIVIVGSARTKAVPRDLDIVHFVSMDEFESAFGNFEKFLEEGRSGIWGADRWQWANLCITQGRELEFRIKEGLRKHPLDYKIYPEGFDGKETNA
jgi:hypothetical protein